jgi:hypothetical protein
MLKDGLIVNDTAPAVDYGDNLLVSSSKWKTLTLNLGSLQLTDKSSVETETISLDDIVGATYSAGTTMLTVVCCPAGPTGKDGKPGPRKLKRVKVPYEGGADAEQCAAAINCVLDGQEIGAEGWDHRRRKLLVLINPFGGSGKAKQTYFKHCDEILNVRFDLGMLVAGFCLCTPQATPPPPPDSVDVHVTTAQNDAKERVKGMALGEYEGVVVVGGDGLVYEVVNGLMERSDAAQVEQHVQQHTYGAQ